MIPQIIDGFSYNSVYRPGVKTFYTNALAQMDVLRRASNYRARWWVLPDIQGQPIQPYDTFDYQVEVADRSYLYGYNFTTILTTFHDETISNDNARIQINATDSCTNVPIFQDYCSGANGSTSFTDARIPLILLSQPRLILEPGLVSVSMTNTGPNTITCQLILFFAEGCKLIDDQPQEPRITVPISTVIGRSA